MRMCMVSVIVIGSFNGRARIPVVLLALFRGAVVTMSAHHPVAPIVGLVPMAQIPIRGCCTVRQTIRKALTSVMPPTQALGSNRDHENTRTWVQLHVDVMTRPVWTTRRGLQLHLSHERNKLLLGVHRVPVCSASKTTLHCRVLSRVGRCGPQQEKCNQAFTFQHRAQEVFAANKQHFNHDRIIELLQVGSY